MPYAPTAACLVSTCPAPRAHGAYCSQHSPERQRPSAARRGYGSGSGWPEIRAGVLSLRPYCEAKGCRSLASEVHHEKRLRDGGTNDYDNLVALCRPCHSRISAREDAGISRPRAGVAA
jgi:5-methylcytosine-specific restriction protein A